jgi:hypothetical protein
MRLKVRSMVGLIPLFATAVFPGDLMDKLPAFMKRTLHFAREHSALMAQISNPLHAGVGNRRLLAVFNPQKLRRILERLLDEAEFLSPYGIRSLSRYHREHPYEMTVDGHTYRVDYEPAESSTGLFGGNSNWRGPIWMPVNALLVQSLRKLYCFYGEAFTVECPKGSGRQLSLWDVADEIARRLNDIFLHDASGRRPVYGGTEKFQRDPHWRDLVLFYEYFHGDNGAGLGAGHQTGWTGLVAWLLMSRVVLDKKEALEKGFDIVAMKAFRPA